MYPGAEQKNLHHAQLFYGVGEPYDQLFVLFESLLHAVNLAENDGAGVVRLGRRGRGRGRILSGRKEGFLGQLLGKIDERHLL